MSSIKFTIQTILAVLKYPMPRIKFQGHLSIGLREEDFFLLSTSHHVGHVTNFVPSAPEDSALP